MKAFRSVVAVFLAVLVGSGCEMKPITKFSAYPRRAPTYDRVAIVGDMIVVRDAAGIHDAINVQENLEAGREMEAVLADGLKESGYDVVASTVAGIGVDVKASTPSLKLEGEGLTGKDLVSLPLGIDKSFADDPAKLAALRNTVGILDGFRYQASGATETWPICGKISAIAPSNSDAVLVMLARRRNVSGWKSLGMGLATGLGTVLTTGFMYSTWAQTGSYVAIHLVDAKTGEILWSDNNNEEQAGGATSTLEMENQLKKMLQRMPKRA